MTLEVLVRGLGCDSAALSGQVSPGGYQKCGFTPSVGREAGVRRAGALVARWAKEQECKLKWECKRENLSELD